MRRLIVVALVGALACVNHRKVPEGVAATRASDAPVPAEGEAARAAVVQLKTPGAYMIPATPQVPVRMIIRNANVSVVVRDAVDALRKISAQLEARGGYIAQTRQWKDHDQVRASVTLRVPAAQLWSTLDSIHALAVRIDSESVTAEDVSQEYTDLGARLRNLQAAETELRELLKTVRERTEKASEIMEIYDQITKVRGEIETIQARQQYLSQMTALSTINVDLIPDVLAAPVVEPGWQPVATVRAATRALVGTLKFLAECSIWTGIYLLPIGLLFVSLALLIRVGWVRLRRPRRT